MTVLLDSSVLIAVNVGDHTHYPPAVRWFQTVEGPFATCPITQVALIRHLMRGEQTAADAVRVLKLVIASPRHEFWPDDVGSENIRSRGLIGHRQVTDAYLAELARHRRGRIATFDKGFAALHDDVAELVPVGS